MLLTLSQLPNVAMMNGHVVVCSFNDIERIILSANFAALYAHTSIKPYCLILKVLKNAEINYISTK